MNANDTIHLQQWHSIPGDLDIWQTQPRTLHIWIAARDDAMFHRLGPNAAMPSGLVQLIAPIDRNSPLTWLLPVNRDAHSICCSV